MISELRKSLLIFLAMLLFLSARTEGAFAHIPCQCDNPPDQCTCFIQLGDKGLAVERIICMLRKKGYLQKTEPKNEFTPVVRQAVVKFQTDHGLECTGWMDDETLNALLFDIQPDLDGRNGSDICYVPTDGGQRYHTNPLCSDMYHPRLISRLNAKRLDIKHCRRNTCLKYSPRQTDSYASLRLSPRILPDAYYEEDEADADQFAEVPDDAITERSLPVHDEEYVYIGNKKTHVFHNSSCGSVKDMSEKNRIVFQSRDEAVENGYRPCSRCNP